MIRMVFKTVIFAVKSIKVKNSELLLGLLPSVDSYQVRKVFSAEINSARCWWKLVTLRLRSAVLIFFLPQAMTPVWTAWLTLRS